ncbi:MAG: AAA family ATPase [Chloroflexi bacterium]|nr:AAA family ATPase [Chloroflexota bacterium]
MTSPAPSNGLSASNGQSVRKFSVVSLVSPLLREQLSVTSSRPTNGQIQRFQAIVVRIRIDGLTDEAVQNSIVSSKASVITTLFNTLYAPLLQPLQDAKITLAELSMNRLTAIVPLESVAQAGRVLQTLTAVEKSIEATLDKTPPGYPHIHWKIAAGAGIGQVATFVFNSEGLQRNVFIFGGPAIDQADQALALAKDGKVITHRDVLKRLGSAPMGQWVASNFFLPEGSFAESQVGEALAKGQNKRSSSPLPVTGNSSTIATAEMFIDPLLRAGSPFHSVQEGVLTEHLACIVLRIKGITLSTDEVIPRWTSILENVLDIASRYGALLDRIAVEADQSEIRLVFGVPHIQEQSSRNAAGCALALQRALNNSEPSLHMAIASGTGFAALLGHEYFSPYTVISPALITASQLADTADAREVVGDETTQHATEKIFGWRAMTGSRVGRLDAGFTMTGEISLGGGLSTRYQIARQIPLVGRDAERDQIRKEAQRGLSGANHLLLMTGDSGNGRSALIDELIGQWLTAGGSGFISIGPAHVPAAPYTLWIPIWQFLFGLFPESEPAASLEKLQLSLIRMLPDAESAIPMFAEVLGLTPNTSPMVDGLKPEVRQERLFSTTLYLLRQVAELSPLMLIFEYLDNSDALSLDLLKKLADSLESYPVLFCVEDRSNSTHSLAHYFANPTHIAAKPLSGQDAWRLLNHFLPDIPWPVHYRAALAEFLNIYDPAHGESNNDSKANHTPANIVGLATVLEHGLLKRRGGQWDFDNTPPPQDWPRDWPEITDYLVNKILGARERQVMFYTAADSMTFYNNVPWIKKHAHPALVELNRMRELHLCERYVDEGPTRRWDRFRHQNVRETLYAHLDVNERAETHQQIAVWQMLRAPGHAGKALVAYHLEHAGEIRGAVDAYLDASRFAAAWGANSEAMQSVLAAERLIARQENEVAPSVSLKIRLAWADLYLRQNNLEKAIAETSRAIDYAEQIGEPIPLASSLIIRARSEMQRRNYSAVGIDANRAIGLLQNSEAGELAVEAKWLQARALFANQQRQHAVRVLARAVEADPIANPRLEIEMRLDVAHYLMLDYQRDRAFPHIQQAHQKAEKLGDPTLLQQATAQLGRLKILYGEAEEGIEILERALRMPSVSDGNRTPGHLHQDHALALCFLGRYDAAATAFDEAEKYFISQKDTASLAHLQLLRAYELFLDREHYDHIEATLQKFESDSQPSSEDLDLLASLLRLALHIHRKQFDDANQLLQKLNTRSVTSAMLWYRPVIALYNAELVILQGNVDDADQFLHQALGAVGVQGDLRYLTAIYAGLAEVKIMRDEKVEAIQDALDRAETAGRRQGRRIHLAKALLLYGQYLKHTSHRYSTRARASTFLFEASLLYKEMGLPMPEQVASFGAQG